MAIGASLSGTANQSMDRNGSLRKRPVLGVRTNYVTWRPESPLFPFVKYSGIFFANWHNAIIVNQVGKRFYNEMENGYPNGTTKGFYKDGNPYGHGDWRNTTRIKYRPRNYIDVALAINEGSRAPEFSAGPQWAIFDVEGLKREQVKLNEHSADPELFFVADTIEELAKKINTSPWQAYKMDPAVLKASVDRYNDLVKAGADTDFDKPKPKFTIEKGPFYAAWATFAVLDWEGKVIEGLWCGGESAGSSSQHGLGRCLTQGYVIGQKIAA